MSTVRAAVAAAVVVVALLLVGCAPRPGINYGQWRYPATVKLLSSALPSAYPMTYSGHDPYASLAVDFMVAGAGRTAVSVAAGNRLAALAVSLAFNPRWHIHYVVWRQRIWNIQRAREGWRLMPNRGGWTANHMDHVHMSMW